MQFHVNDLQDIAAKVKNSIEGYCGMKTTMQQQRFPLEKTEYFL
jgi:hypothetical protein